jgi:hypothetical protein
MLITFGCDDVAISDEYDSPLSCEDDGGDPTWAFGPAEIPMAYDRADDSTFEIRVSENIESACGGAPRDVIIRFTKVE